MPHNRLAPEAIEGGNTRAVTPIDDWADQISGAMLKPLRQVGLLLAREIEDICGKFDDQQVYIAALERRIAKLEDRVL